ncbi:hypothetical protein [Amycolatopsis sp. La24]|uniref:hypothetical protein n=1 Tax=Amycolatopsis sp. La24 TaxID=3028304 RepID=UPI0023AF32F9|nr:hypothetical protein [Amycolatopsis sp. La24]
MRSFAAIAVAATLLLSGCGNGDDGATQKRQTEQAMKQVLKEYQPRFEQRRAALAAVAKTVPATSPAKPSCDRKLSPKPEFISLDGNVMDSYNSPGKGGNVALLQASEATTLESMEDRAGQKQHQFSLPAGWLVQGMWITGPQGPLGTGHFKVDATYGYEPYGASKKTQSPG